MGKPARIEWVSPSAVARLQACGLAESLQRRQPRGKRPSNPVARLGNAAHRVLEWIAESAPQLGAVHDVEPLIADRWLEEVTREEEANRSNPLEPPYGPAQRWPAYGRITAGLRVDGVGLVEELSSLPRGRRLPEQELFSSDRKIRGTADLILLADDGSATIIDHKTGGVDQDDVGHGGRYEQQILLYVAIARDSGISATKAEIRPLGRRPVPVELSDASVAAVLVEAHAQMRRYNDAVAQDRALDLATPSESSCGWCPFLLECPAVWVDPAPDLGELAVVEGDVETLQVLASSLALALRNADGCVTVTGAPRTDVRGREPVPGDRIRVTGLHQTSPGHMRCHPGRGLMSVL